MQVSLRRSSFTDEARSVTKPRPSQRNVPKRTAADVSSVHCPGTRVRLSPRTDPAAATPVAITGAADNDGPCDHPRNTRLSVGGTMS